MGWKKLLHFYTIIYVMIGTTTNRVAEDGMEETTTLSIIIIYVMIGTTTNRVAEDGWKKPRRIRTDEMPIQ